MKRLLSITLILLGLLGLNWTTGHYLNAYALLILNLIGIKLIMSASLNLINGYTGQFNLGHAGFMAVGAYTSAAFSVFAIPLVQPHLSFIPNSLLQPILFLMALGLGGCAAGLSGLIIGTPTLRLRGDYLAIATLGFGEIIQVAITNMNVVGGARGFVNIPEFSNFFWIFLFSILTLWIVGSITRSTKGLSFLAIREDEIASASLGIPGTQVKVKAFVIGAFLAGLGGGLFAHLYCYLNVNQFSFLYSVEFVVMVVLGGLGNLWGVALATVLLTVLPEMLRPFAQWRMVIYSLLIISTMLLRSKGFSLKGIFPRLERKT